MQNMGIHPPFRIFPRKGAHLSPELRRLRSPAAVYARLSRDDDLDGESNSIRNQKQKCAEVATSLGYAHILYYVDDGISGMVEQRPAFQKLIRDIKSGMIGAVICKDQSRLSGNKLGYHFNQKNPDIKYFNCSAYNKRHRECEKSHYVRADFLEKVVLGEFRRLTKFVGKYSDSFEKAVRGFAKDKTELEVKRREKDLKAAQGRSNDIDVIIQKLYEDKVGRLISDERFAKLSAQYEQEQAALSEKVSALQAAIRQEAERAQETDVFIAAVKKYSRIRKLTQQMLYDLVDRIEVHHAQKIDGITV